MEVLSEPGKLLVGAQPEPQHARLPRRRKAARAGQLYRYFSGCRGCGRNNNLDCLLLRGRHLAQKLQGEVEEFRRNPADWHSSQECLQVFRAFGCQSERVGRKVASDEKAVRCHTLIISSPDSSRQPGVKNAGKRGLKAKKAVFADLVNYGIREVPCCVRDAAFKFCTNTSKSGSNSQQVM